MVQLGTYILVFLLMLAPSLGLAVQPDEILADPALEKRARTISRELRCMVCQNESIDESNAPLARDLRLLVRERLVQGDSDTQVIDFLVARYGDFVLLRPRWSAQNALLWATPVIVLLFGAGLVGMMFRRRPLATPVGEVRPLTEDETTCLRALLNDNPNRTPET